MVVDKNNLPEAIPVGTAKDLGGQIFGSLKVLYRIKHPNGKSNITWLCQCLLCGRYCTAYGCNLKSGKVHSCGCDSTNILKDLIGMTFGRLTVVDRAPDIIESDRHHSVAWYCKCSCGNPDLIIVRGSSLTRGLTSSCGCIHHEVCSKDITGHKFGRLTAIRPLYRESSKRSWVWQFECECGNLDYQTTVTSVTSGHTQSCGCDKSRGESKLCSILRENNIDFDIQYWFDDLRFEGTNYPAFFDIRVKTNIPFLLEWDGNFHFYPEESGWNTREHYIKTHSHDIIKNQYAFDNNIPIKRIPFTQLDTVTIEDILSTKYLITCPEDFDKYHHDVLKSIGKI